MFTLPIQWLLDGPPWVQYRTQVDLLGKLETAADVQAARREMIAHPSIRALVDELAAWPGPVLKSHKDAAHPLHRLVFLADLGLKVSDPGMGQVIERIFSLWSTDGVPQVLANIRPAYGGTGADTPAWMLCDAPLVLYALQKFGVGEDGRVLASLQRLALLARSNGWPCVVSPELGRFRGPGRKSDPCPYATLVMTRALSQAPDCGGAAGQAGCEALLALWEGRQASKPYLFGMGSDFIKLKAPLIWYDLLHVLDVLTQYPHLHDDPRLQEWLEILNQKVDNNGCFTPESIWMAWKGWDFGQKREPSRWLTLVSHRILNRARASA